MNPAYIRIRAGNEMGEKTPFDDVLVVLSRYCRRITDWAEEKIKQRTLARCLPNGTVVRGTGVCCYTNRGNPGALFRVVGYEYDEGDYKVVRMTPTGDSHRDDGYFCAKGFELL